MSLDTAPIRETLAAKWSARLALWLEICARCGLCAKGCHFFQSDPRPEHVPAYRLKPLRRLLAAKGRITEEEMASLVDTVYGTCTMCQRCTMFCPHGINIAYLVRTTRALAVSVGQTPKGLAAGLSNALEMGNNLGITAEEYQETLDWQHEEVQEELPDALCPVDKKGARSLVTFHPRDIKFYPGNLYSYLKLYNAMGEDFTFTSQGWDSTNIGLFAGDDAAAGALAGRVVSAAERLAVQRVVTAE
jgi:Fe-S oxidoreductase